MPKINVLPFEIANLIAAGEVVDRPCSVIKELLENAIDSGADKITVEIQDGGVTYMRVTDNGCGIAADDVPLAIRRHATSKIKNAEDLASIMTLGFRGEALAAIASVSELRIVSKTHDASVGTMMTSRGGNIISVMERPMADGTSVIVENLFANVPARLKFLKKDTTEALAVSAMVEKIALSRPDIAFKLIIDGKMKLQTAGDGKLYNAIYSLFGRDFASRLIEANASVDGVSVRGYVGRPDNVRANRNYQNFFINGRYVKTKTALAAIEQAYTSYMASDKYPCCVLFIDINPATVDVNVHPAKLEVKFSNERPVFEAIYYCVRNALEKNTSRPDINLSAPREQRVSDRQTSVEDTRRESLAKRQLQSDIYIQKPLTAAASVQTAQSGTEKGQTFEHITAEEYLRNYMSSAPRKDVPQRPAPKAAPAPQRTSAPVPTPVQPTPQRSAEQSVKAETAPTSPRPYYRIIGEAFNSYIIVESDDKLLLIDKHAAHERIIFEQLRSAMKNESGRATQLLMLPLEIMMTSEEAHLLEEYREELCAVGFGFEKGSFCIRVTEIPEGISTAAVPDMLTVMAERIKASTGTVALTRELMFEKALYQASCKAAIKAGREYPAEYSKWVVDKLMELPDITVCPHGRPVAIELTHKNLDYQFERS